MFDKPVLLGVLLVIGLLCASSAVADKHGKMATTGMLVNTCIACHGSQGISEGPAIPSLAGLTRNYLIGAMLAYKFHGDEKALEKAVEAGGKSYEDVLAFPRYSTIMSRIAGGYTTEEIEAMVDYFAAQKPRAVRQQADPAMAEEGRKLHKAKCEKCHEDGGRSPEDDVGILAGQWMPYLEYTLQDYLDDKRKMPKKMKSKLSELYEERGAKGIASLIQYYGRAQ